MTTWGCAAYLISSYPLILLSSYLLISTPLILLFSGGHALREGRLRHPLRPRSRQAPGIHTCLKHLSYWSITLDNCRWWRRAWWLLWTSTWTRSTWRWPSWSHSSRTGWVYWPTDHQLVNWHLENLITQPHNHTTWSPVITRPTDWVCIMMPGSGLSLLAFRPAGGLLCPPLRFPPHSSGCKLFHQLYLDIVKKNRFLVFFYKNLLQLWCSGLFVHSIPMISVQT